MRCHNAVATPNRSACYTNRLPSTSKDKRRWLLKVLLRSPSGFYPGLFPCGTFRQLSAGDRYARARRFLLRNELPRPLHRALVLSKSIGDEETAVDHISSLALHTRALLRMAWADTPSCARLRVRLHQDSFRLIVFAC